MFRFVSERYGRDDGGNRVRFPGVATYFLSLEKRQKTTRGFMRMLVTRMWGEIVT